MVILLSNNIIVFAAQPVIISDVVSLGYYEGSISGTPYTKELKNDLESLNFVVELSKIFADAYSPSGTTHDHNNLVIGYLREINNSYYNTSEEYFKNWQWIAGGVDLDFISYILVNDNSEFKIIEYLACFLGSANSYNSVYGNINTSNVNYGTYFIDPLNPENDKNMIDLTHMFATIDGSYSNTGGILEFSYGFQKDLSGWAGDLQTYARNDIFGFQEENLENYDYNTNIDDDVIDFNEFNNILQGTFSNEDMLADIDGLNIAVNYLDDGYSVSYAIAKYYEDINSDNLYGNNRYWRFVQSIASDTEINDDDIEYKFMYEVYKSMAYTLLFSGDLIENRISITDPTYYLLRNKEIIAWIIPYPYQRQYCANLFIDYILDMSTPPGSGSVPGDPNPGPGYEFEQNSLVIIE